MNRKRFKNVEVYKEIGRITQNKYIGIADMNGLYAIMKEERLGVKTKDELMSHSQ